MNIKNDWWYFLNEYDGKSIHYEHHLNHVRLFCRKQDYDVFVLVSIDVLDKLRYEPEVAGFSMTPSFKTPFPVYAVGLNTDNIQPILDKYSIEAILRTKGTGAINYEHNNKYDKEWSNA